MLVTKAPYDPETIRRILANSPDKKVLIKIITLIDEGGKLTATATRRNIVKETKLPLYFVDRVLYLLNALGLIYMETVGRTQVLYTTALLTDVVNVAESQTKAQPES